MKSFKIFIGIISALFILPVQIYANWLLYTHVHATPIMWFLWWFIWPWTFIIAIASSVVTHVERK